MTEFLFLGALAILSKHLQTINTILHATTKTIYESSKIDCYLDYNKTGHHRAQVTLYHKFGAVLCNLSFPSTERLWKFDHD